MSGGAEDAGRVVSLPLMIGLVTLPWLFGWLLLRRGYSSSLRRIVLICALGWIGVVGATLVSMAGWLARRAR